MADLIVVAGAQFGSEGKGAVAAHLTRDFGLRDIAIRVAGPNAGHTAYDKNGVEWKLRALPVAAVTNPDCQLHIAAGSEVDVDVLTDEVRRAEEAGHKIGDRLTIHPSATLMSPRHQAMESEGGLVGRIGSTGKGIGAARSERIWRRANTVGDLDPRSFYSLSDPGPFDVYDAERVLIEGTQGYGLGLHTPYYPTVTSSDCRAIDFLAMAGISPWAQGVDSLNVILVARVYPIRVAGNSGPLGRETSWQQLGLPEERTTVTNKVRRVGAWDPRLVAQAIEGNGGGNYSRNVQLAITMLDQLLPELRDSTRPLENEPARRWLRNVQDHLRTFITLVGTGPNTMSEVHLP